MPLVSIIIPCRNEALHIRACVESALRQEPPDGGFEVLVVDGDSDDGTVAILQSLAAGDERVRLLSNAKRIVSAGLNEAIRHATGEIIVRMDAHTQYAPDYVVSCVRALRESGAANVGGPARTKAETFMEQAIAAAYHSRFAVGGARFHDVEYEGFVDTVTYGCWLKASFDRFGMFDEELVRNQDDEHNLRIVRQGGKVWQTPRIRSWYRPRGSLRALLRQYSQYGYWKVRVIQKHRIPASWRHLVPGLFLLCIALPPIVCPLISAASAAGEAIAGATMPVLEEGAAWVLRGWSGLLLCYLFGVVVASVSTARRTRWSLVGILPAVFWCYHFGYGLGFLRGVLDFIVLRKAGAEGFGRLTR